MKTIGILSETLPNLPSEPGSPRLFSLMSEWSRKYRIILLCVSAEKPVPAELRRIVADVKFLGAAPASSFLGKIRHRLKAAPYFSQAFRNPAYLEGIWEAVSRLDVDHIHVNQLSSAQFVPPSWPSKRVTIDVRDALPLLYLREASLCPNWVRRRELRSEAKSLGKYIRSLASRGYPLTMVAQADADYLAKEWASRTVVIPNGVDLTYFSGAENRNRSKPVAIFTGVMNYEPNVETVLYFTKNIFPLVKSRCPEFEFWIVGAKPTESVADLAKVEGVQVTGRVPDIRPYLFEASVFVCPMHSGAGIKNKILAAMAAKLPIVATPLGIAGVDAKDGEHCFVCEDDREFAATVAGIINGEIPTSDMVERSHDLVSQNYEWRSLAAKFENLFEHADSSRNA